jgi:hypothetical protein
LRYLWSPIGSGEPKRWTEIKQDFRITSGARGRENINALHSWELQMSPVNSTTTKSTKRAFRHALPVFYLLLAASAWPQTPTGQVTGRITDATGAVAPGSEVVVTSVDKGLVRKTVCNDAGYYTVSLLPPGEYRVDVHREGFRSATRTGITLAVDQIERLDFQLEVGNVYDTVEVSASAPAVTTGTAALGTVVGTQQVQDLPLNNHRRGFECRHPHPFPI